MKWQILICLLLISALLIGIVDADAAPVAAFSANVTTGCAPLHVAFTDASTRSPTNWDWYWWANETKTSDLQNPTAIFPAGTYNVRLYVNTATHGDWENKTGYIATTGAPVAAFSGTPTSGTEPLSVQFNDTSSNSPDNWDWYWSADEVKDSDTRNATNSFDAGTYNVRLYVSNCGGGQSDWENKTGYITANAAAGESFNPATYGNWTEFIVNSTSAQTDYQVKHILDNRTGSSTTTLFYTNGTTNSTWEDIVWTDTSNATLSFWKENRTDTTTNTTWWIKVPSIASDNTTKIRLFYGNASKTTSFMNGSATFELFDDFNNGTTLNTTMWNVTGTPTVSNSNVSLDGGDYIFSFTKWGWGYAVRTRHKYPATTGNAQVGWLVGMYAPYARISSYVNAETTAQHQVSNEAGAGSNTNEASITAGWRVWDVRKISTSLVAFDWNNRESPKTLTSNIPTSTTMAWIGSDSPTVLADWIAVRKYPTSGSEPFLTLNVTAAPPVVTPPVAKFAMSIYGQLPPSGTLIPDASNPTMPHGTFNPNIENSIIQDPTNETIVDNWYRTDTPVSGTAYYTNATNALADNWNTNTIRLYDIPTGTSFEYVLYDPTTAKYYMFIKQATPSMGIYLYNSTNKINWSIMNGGNSVVAEATTAATYTIYNPGVAIVNDTYWAMLIEGKSNGGSRFTISYTYSNLTEMNWTKHLSSGAVIDPGGGQGAGNPDLKYVADRNAVLAVTGYTATSTWKIGTFYASLSDDLTNAASWHYNGDLITATGIHVADPYVATLKNKTHNTVIGYNYNQEEMYQQFFDMTLTNWYDYLKGDDPWANQVLTGVSPFTVNFTDMSTNTPTSWNYTFQNVTGDNIQTGFSTSQNTTRAFIIGNYSIKLNATNAGGSNISAQISWVNVSATGGVSAPVASFTVNRNPARIPQSITVTDTSTNTPTSWAWSWGDGTANSTTQNPTHEYTKRGRFNIILTATNAGGSGTNSANYVRVVGYENYY